VIIIASASTIFRCTEVYDQKTVFVGDPLKKSNNFRALIVCAV